MSDTIQIKIGTRGSKLALWQAYFIEEQLKKEGVKTQVITIETKGDKILDRALSKIGSKGVFTEELEEKLHTGEIDIAVHSAKDLQSELGDELSIISFSKREKINDVLISLNSDLKLNKNSSFVVGTSSTRRVAMLKAFYPNIKIVDVRGNLQTRIKKMENGLCDALLLAYAGVHRMEYGNMIIHEFDSAEFVPAVGQGTVAIEISNSLDEEKKTIIRKACNDETTEICLKTERSFLKKLQGGCSIPVFGNAKLVDNQIAFTAGIISLDGKEIIKEIIKDDINNSEELGITMASKILSLGGDRILSEIKANLS
jgi:hydroxymethylbilane synthase